MLDLFAGTGGASRAFREAGWEVVTVDNDPAHQADVVADLRAWSWTGRRPTLVWASPPCQEFSRMSMPWTRAKNPPAPSRELVETALRIVRETRPHYWVVENVRGAIPYLRPLLGRPRLSCGPLFLWGYFPWFRVSVAPFKEHLSSRDVVRRAAVPRHVSTGLLEAISYRPMFDLGVSEHIGTSRAHLNVEPGANMLVLSIFPGIDLLGLAFEREGFTVVRGPDPIFGGDVKTFHPPAGVFSGIVGGPPCQIHSRLRFLNPRAGQKHGDLIPEFERVVAEAQPDWFLMENVPEAPPPVVAGYVVRALILNNRWLGGDQQRERRFSFGTHDGRRLDISPDVAVFESPLEALAVTASLREAVPVRMQRARGGGHVLKKRLRPPSPPTVVAGHGTTPAQRDAGLDGVRSMAEMCRLQGLPEDFADELPFTTHGKRKVIGNGVPLTTGQPVARAVKRAMTQPNSQ